MVFNRAYFFFISRQAEALTPAVRHNALRDRGTALIYILFSLSVYKFFLFISVIGYNIICRLLDAVKGCYNLVLFMQNKSDSGMIYVGAGGPCSCEFNIVFVCHLFLAFNSNRFVIHFAPGNSKLTTINGVAFVAVYIRFLHVIYGPTN